MTEPAKEKMAPVQGFVGGIPWSLHLEAYNAYCKKWSPQPALIDLEGRNCRGGFGTGELDEFIPGWRDKASEIGRLKAELAGLRAKVAQQAALVEKCMAAMNENADRGEKAEARLAALEGQEPVALLAQGISMGVVGAEKLYFPHERQAAIEFCTAAHEKGGYPVTEIKPLYAAAGAAPGPDIDAMVSRFLSWNLPNDFYPDGYISFSRDKVTSPSVWPSGTNLLTAEQARKMFEYVMAPTPCQVKFHTESAPDEITTSTR